MRICAPRPAPTGDGQAPSLAPSSPSLSPAPGRSPSRRVSSASGGSRGRSRSRGGTARSRSTCGRSRSARRCSPRQSIPSASSPPVTCGTSPSTRTRTQGTDVELGTAGKGGSGGCANAQVRNCGGQGGSQQARGLDTPIRRAVRLSGWTGGFSSHQELVCPGDLACANKAGIWIEFRFGEGRKAPLVSV